MTTMHFAHETYQYQNANWKTFKKISVSNFFKSSFIFVNFALFNGLLPLFICLILSCLKPMGGQYTMAIGYITAIQLGFVQFSWSISIGIFYGFYKQEKTIELKDPSEFFMNFFIVTLIYSIFATMVFIGSAYAYNYYASKHLNTLFGQRQAFYYIYIVWIYIFLNSFIYGFFVFIQVKKSAFLANVLLWLYIATLVGLLALSTLLPNRLFNIPPEKSLWGLWTGYALSIGALIWFGILCLSFRFKWNISFKFYKEYWVNIRQLFAKSHRQLLLIATIQFFKAIALIVLGFTITDTINGIVPIFYQMSRVIWYNILYILPFLGYGIADSILYYGFYYQEDIDPVQLNKLTIGLFIFVLIFELGLSVGIYYLIPYLSKIYITNLDPDVAMNQYNIDEIQLVPLIESLLKKESIINALSSQEELEQLMRDYVNQIDYAKIPGLSEESINRIKKFINIVIMPSIPKIAQNITERAQNLVDPTTRVAAINEILDKLREIPKLGDNDLRAIKTIVALKLEHPSAETIDKMFTVNTANTYYFMVAWTTLYSCGLIFNSSKMLMRKNVYTWWQTALIALVQAIIIGAVVAIGVTQQYTNALLMYDAWTMPLCLSGIIIFGFYLITYIVRYKKCIVQKDIQTSSYVFC